MTTEAFFTLLTLALAAAWTPGPNNALLATSGISFGLRRTVPDILGVALGFPVMVFLVGMFLGVLFQTSVLLQEVLRYGGAAMLLWVAWKIATAGGIGSGKGRTRPFYFHEAAAFQWINPKGWVMAISLTAQFVNPARPIQTALIVTAVFFGVGVTSALGWAAGGVVLRRFLSTGNGLKAFNIAMGVLIALGVVVLFRH